MGAWLKLEMSGGTSIERACQDACRVANKLGIMVEFDFNGVTCMASPQGYADLLAQRQQEEQRRKLRGPHDRRFASSDPRAASNIKTPPPSVSEEKES